MTDSVLSVERTESLDNGCIANLGLDPAEAWS
jgi:hypothetical protein